MNDDLISRQAAIEALEDAGIINYQSTGDFHGIINALTIIKNLPTAEPEIKPIEYRDCANAMLRMWMDNVVTDGEYNRIMNKLNAYCPYCGARMEE